MIPMLALALALTAAPDTTRVEIGSKDVDGRVYAPHRARVRVFVGEGKQAVDTRGELVAEWTNELALGDSAGRPVMRWVTLGTRFSRAGKQTWEIRQTYDHVTLAPYGYASSRPGGAATRLAIDGRRVTGTRQAAGGSAEPVDRTVERMGFIASASDLVPTAVGLRDGLVIIAPIWGPGMATAETRIFMVIGRTPTMVEGHEWNAWKVEERRDRDGALLAAWYLVDESPYMVYGEIDLPDGRVRRMYDVALPDR